MTLTKREMDLMRIVWGRRGVTVREVYEEIRSNERVAYTTVILEPKGRLRKHRVGKAFAYTPAVSRDQAVEEILRELVDRLFGGCAAIFFIQRLS